LASADLRAAGIAEVDAVDAAGGLEAADEVAVAVDGGGIVLLRLHQVQVGELAVRGESAGVRMGAAVLGIGGLEVPAVVDAGAVPDVDARGIAGVEAVGSGGECRGGHGACQAERRQG